MILKIYPEELLPIKFCVINNLKLETICIWCVAKKTCCNDLKLAVGGIKSEVRPNKQLAEEGSEITEMQLMSRYNREFGFCYVLLIFSLNIHKYPSKDKKGETNSNTF